MKSSGSRLDDAYDEEANGSRKSPQVLPISSDLEALLEYDEQARRASSLDVVMQPITTQKCTTFSGLPPPPRKTRASHSPNLSRVEGQVPQTAPSSPGSPVSITGAGRMSPLPSANPYINPTPSFQEAWPNSGSSSSMTTKRISNEPHDHDRIPEDTSEVVKNLADGRIGNNGHVSIQKQSPSDNPTAPPKRRVGKLLNVSKNAYAFSLFTDTSTARAELHDVSNSLTRGRGLKIPPQLPVIRARSTLVKGGSLKRKNAHRQGDSSSNMQHLHDQPVLDIRRPSSPELAAAMTPQGQISHGPWLPSPSPSRSSSDSGSSATSDRPASTIDPRISISSTIYPASSAHSHTQVMYHAPDPLPIIPPYRSSSLSPIERETGEAGRKSFIDIFSPAEQEFTINQPQLNQPFAPHLAPSQSKFLPPIRTSSPKPPLPTTPKPKFTRQSPSSAHPSTDTKRSFDAFPSSGNFLDLGERADLIRKNRKLAQYFGKPPAPELFSQQEPGKRHNIGKPSPASSTKGHHRGALSDDQDILPGREPSSQFVNVSGRRFSIPLSPDDFSFVSTEGASLADLYNGGRPLSSDADSPTKDQIRPSSPTSFIDLSDDLTTPRSAARPRPASPSYQSILENMSPEEQAEEERRRKREKLAKLHRFLGSRVPVSLVIPGEDPDSSLPALGEPSLRASDEATRKDWLRRRRRSSVAALPADLPGELDRLREDLNVREKAINVRRAQKMEKVFGVAPPQTLYHTRRAASPSLGAAGNKLANREEASFSQRNPNRSAYTKKSKSNDRPGTAESSKHLIPKDEQGRSIDAVRDAGRSNRRRSSVVYSHYQHSLNSLNDILERDDRESLAELHEYLTSNNDPMSPTKQDGTRPGNRRLSSASSLRSERRHSLPARTSVISISPSEYSDMTPRPEATDFQARRRRAAKLMQFFGVDYRELISEVLESIESGVEQEGKRGTLNAEEVEDLLSRLRNLRTKRIGLF